MAQINSREIVLLAETTVTTSGTGPVLNLPMGYTAVIASVNVKTVSGTSPTLNVRIQNQFTPAAATDLVGAAPTGTVLFQDYISFNTATTSNTVFDALSVGAGNAAQAQEDGTLAAGTIRNGPIGANWRVKYTVGGTSPSFVFSVSALLIP